MTRVLALAGQSKIGCITQRRFAKVGTKIHPQPGAALDRNGLSGSTETACRFEPKSPVGNSEICILRHCRKLSFPAKGPSGGRTLLAQNAVQPELGRAHHVGNVPPDKTAATDPATK